ncbi:hypothetical protein BDGGKGIB_01139 [Nodularia sphaerocarpa UHCC 0038]|nr:hypothetical protein BDGGKGIB_01139 [Nodularia sphaerocarpa UHCC 0038]
MERLYDYREKTIYLLPKLHTFLVLHYTKIIIFRLK